MFVIQKELFPMKGESDEPLFEKGFTLIEAMITVVIVSVAVLAMASLLIGNMGANRGSEQRFNAAAVSEGILNEYHSRFDALTWTPSTTVGDVTTVTKSQANSEFGLAYTITATAVAEGLMLVVTIDDDRLSSPYVNQTMILTLN